MVFSYLKKQIREVIVINLSTFEAIKKISADDKNCIRLEGDLLKKYQNVLIKIAEDIISVCEEEKIFYQLSGGSALGAVRHKGIIPWDDDIDINMLGSETERFVKKFRKKFPDKYYVTTYRTKGYDSLIYTVKLKGTVSRGIEFADVPEKQCGIGIDIFRIENTFDSKILRNVHGFFCMSMGFLLSCRKFYHNRKRMLALTKNNPELHKVTKIKVNAGRLLSFLPVEKWVAMTHKCYSLCKNNRSEYVSIPAGRKHYFGEMYLRKGMIQTVQLDFEGHKWNVARDYNDYLTKLYGNYMEIPPEDKREHHVLLELKLPQEYEKN